MTAERRRAAAPAKLNLALVVGPPRPDGKHELLTVYQRLNLVDRIELAPAATLRVEGFEGDTIVRRGLEALAGRAGAAPAWRVRIEKRIPVSAGLGGGSSDAATALRLANETLAEPLPPEELHRVAAALGADVPFFLRDGPQLGSGDGSELEPLDLPQDYWVVLVLPAGAAKESTASVYAAFDARDGADGWEERRKSLHDALAAVRRPRDLAALPPNDLARSPLADELLATGAFRADVSGAGPTLYGLFHHRAAAEAARHSLRRLGRTWIAAPAWYG
jgi:4-diphosphocytidyl-2-C-methyl-D-erythritol kinase